MKSLFRLVLLSSIFLLFETCVKNPVTGKKDFMLVSKKQEIAMGKQADPEITSFFGVYDDNKMQRFIRREGKKMAKISHRSELDYEFKIVDSPVINAFAVPGGYIYFTRGIMAQFNNEAEFAGVLGHEIGHVSARHSAKQYSNAMAAELGLAVGSVLSPEFAQFADLARTGVGFLFLKFGRDAENQSDKLGVEYSTKIGYDAAEMADFFNTLDRLTPQSDEVPTFFSTHPHPKDRYNDVRQLAVKWQQKVPEDNFEVNREDYLQKIDGIVYGEDPRQGFVEQGRFFHPELRFTYPIPNGWAIQNTPQQVQMAPQSGNAILMLTLAQSNNLNSAASEILQRYNFKALNSTRTQVNGMNAVAIVAEQQLQDQALRSLVYLIEYQGNIYNFMGVAAPNSFDNYYDQFRYSIERFRQLNDPSKINVQPERIEIEEVENAGTLASVLRGQGVPNNEMEEIALLNGMTLNERVQEGALVKIVE